MECEWDGKARCNAYAGVVCIRPVPLLPSLLSQRTVFFRAGHALQCPTHCALRTNKQCVASATARPSGPLKSAAAFPSVPGRHLAGCSRSPSTAGTLCYWISRCEHFFSHLCFCDRPDRGRPGTARHGPRQAHGQQVAPRCHAKGCSGRSCHSCSQHGRQARNACYASCQHRPCSSSASSRCTGCRSSRRQRWLQHDGHHGRSRRGRSGRHHGR